MSTTTTPPSPSTLFEHTFLHALAHLPWFVYVIFVGGFILSVGFPASRRRSR